MQFLQIANTLHVKEKIGFDPLVRYIRVDLYVFNRTSAQGAKIIAYWPKWEAKIFWLKTFLRLFKDSGTVLWDLNIIFQLSSRVNKMVYSLLVLYIWFFFSWRLFFDRSRCVYLTPFWSLSLVEYLFSYAVEIVFIYLCSWGFIGSSILW